MSNATYDARDREYPAELRRVPGVDAPQDFTFMRPEPTLPDQPQQFSEPRVYTITVKQARERIDKGWQYVGKGDRRTADEA